MTHCGHFSQNTKLHGDQPLKGPTRQFVPIGASVGRFFAPRMPKADIVALVKSYRDAARFMKSVGFDAIEIHFGHAYGLSQFISPKTNRRTDEYGGSPEKRMRVPFEVWAAVRKEVGDNFPIIGKISMSEGVKGGVDYNAGVEVAKSLDKAGINGLVTSDSTSSFNTMLMYRGTSIAEGMIAQQKTTLGRMAFRVITPFLWKKYPYEPNYLLKRTRRIKDAVDCPLIYIGSCSTRADIDEIFDASFDFVQLGCALIREPDFVNKAKADPAHDSGCILCNQCVSLITDPSGIRCVQNDQAA